MKALLRAICAGSGGDRQPSEADLDHATDVCWVLADDWLVFMESRGDRLRKADLPAGVDFFRRAVLPILSSLVTSESDGFARSLNGVS